MAINEESWMLPKSPNVLRCWSGAQQTSKRPEELTQISLPRKGALTLEIDIARVVR